jgi:multiple sugar transport system permease protein
VINATAGVPAAPRNTVSSFIYRVYRDRSNVGYGTSLAIFYLLLIIALLTLLLRLSSHWTRKVV